MVECEYVDGDTDESSATVLIDTWWNVNPIRLVTHCAAAFVLIDTWWNVNHFEEIDKHIIEVVLIDTWWNVNTQ